MVGRRARLGPARALDYVSRRCASASPPSAPLRASLVLQLHLGAGHEILESIRLPRVGAATRSVGRRPRGIPGGRLAEVAHEAQGHQRHLQALRRGHEGHQKLLPDGPVGDADHGEEDHLEVVAAAGLGDVGLLVVLLLYLGRLLDPSPGEVHNLLHACERAATADADVQKHGLRRPPRPILDDHLVEHVVADPGLFHFEVPDDHIHDCYVLHEPHDRGGRGAHRARRVQGDEVSHVKRLVQREPKQADGVGAQLEDQAPRGSTRHKQPTDDEAADSLLVLEQDGDEDHAADEMGKKIIQPPDVRQNFRGHRVGLLEAIHEVFLSLLMLLMPLTLVLLTL
mmetsp:Transcript_40056/g.107499  ORF Transcript_40056/g.107499 Transcript_40056/m.107499 type:complete len:340 (-) Transcript_40056:120-1139(-)